MGDDAPPAATPPVTGDNDEGGGSGRDILIESASDSWTSTPTSATR